MRTTLVLLLMTLALSGCQSLNLGNSEVEQELRVEKLLIKGEKLYRGGELLSAQEAFHKVLELSPNEEQALYRLGNIYFLQKKLDQSAQYFEASITVNPKNSKAHYNLGTIYLMLAQEHMQFFAATAPEEMDISRVSELLASLAEFAGNKEQSSQSDARSSLDKLVNLIENN